jgi:hypothetical protein
MLVTYSSPDCLCKHSLATTGVIQIESNPKPWM